MGGLAVQDRVELANGRGGLLRDDAIAEGPHLGCAREIQVRDEAWLDAHDPLDKPGAQSGLASDTQLGRVGSRSSEEFFPAADSGFVGAPIRLAIPGRVGCPLESVWVW